MTEAHVMATLGPSSVACPSTDVLLDQLVGARFESSPTEVNITCRPDASSTSCPTGPSPYGPGHRRHGTDHGRDPGVDGERLPLVGGARLVHRRSAAGVARGRATGLRMTGDGSSMDSPILALVSAGAQRPC